MTINVFERDHRIVDHTGKGQREATQNHGVHRATQKIQRHKHGQGGKRNGKQNRRGGAQAAEKEQNHDAGEHESEEALMQHRVDGFLDVHRLIEYQAGRHLLGDVIQVADQGSHPVHHLNSVGIAPLLHDGDVT